MSLPQEFRTQHMFTHLADLSTHYPKSSISAQLLKLFAQTTYPWQILNELATMIPQLVHQAHTTQFPELPKDQLNNCDISPACFIEAGVCVESFVTIKQACYISAGATIRAGAYLREHTFVAPNALVGHSTETKNSIFLAGAKAAHHCYIGDSVLGYQTNLGAGTITANIRFDRQPVIIKAAAYHDRSYSRWSRHSQATHRQKIGAFIGDYAQTGCQVVTNPGTMVLPHAQVAQVTRTTSHHHHTDKT